MILNKCYFCDEDPIDQPTKSEGSWFVECWNCGARGPTCGAEDDYENHLARAFVQLGWNKEEYSYDKAFEIAMQHIGADTPKE